MLLNNRRHYDFRPWQILLVGVAILAVNITIVVGLLFFVKWLFFTGAVA